MRSDRTSPLPACTAPAWERRVAPQSPARCAPVRETRTRLRRCVSAWQGCVAPVTSIREDSVAFMDDGWAADCNRCGRHTPRKVRRPSGTADATAAPVRHISWPCVVIHVSATETLGTRSQGTRGQYAKADVSSPPVHSTACAPSANVRLPHAALCRLLHGASQRWLSAAVAEGRRCGCGASTSHSCTASAA